MADPYDFYADIASITAADTGLTLLLLRTLPLPANKDGVISGADEVFEGMAPINAELVARVRISPVFATQLRDLLNRILERGAGQAPAVDQTVPPAAPPGAAGGS
jgi:hypothetical protein